MLYVLTARNDSPSVFYELIWKRTLHMQQIRVFNFYCAPWQPKLVNT